MTRILLGIGAIIAGLLAGVSSFIDRGVDWVDRLDSPETYTIVTTTTPLFTEVPQTVSPRVLLPATSTSLSAKEEVPPPPPPQVKKVVATPLKEKKVVPSPLVSTGGIKVPTVNAKSIVDLTNVERVREGKSILVWNEKLGAMAYAKAKDMLERQYFAHESPDGKNVAGLAEDASYAYVLVGENLAVGNFRTNEELILGWMNSPGHRENMLKAEYTEMGVAAIEGVYEWDRVWMAVQEFGKPLPSCTKPDPAQKEELTKIGSDLTALSESIESAKTAIESTTDQTVRSQKIDDYNMLIELYNALVSRSKVLVETYNDSVRVYNICIES